MAVTYLEVLESLFLFDAPGHILFCAVCRHSQDESRDLITVMVNKQIIRMAYGYWERVVYHLQSAVAQPNVRHLRAGFGVAKLHGHSSAMDTCFDHD